MARACSRVSAPATLLAAFVAVAIAVTAAGAASGGTICDTAKCGKGTCREVPGIIPIISAGYNCTCDPGWSQPKFSNMTIPSAPCTIPNCSFSSSCLNVTVAPPKSIPLTDPCVTANCGQGGQCRKDVGFSYHCQCRPGFQNLFNDTSLPCIGSSCTFGLDCAKLGLGTPGSPAPAPAENH